MVPNAFAALFTWCWLHHRKDRTVLFALHMLVIPGKEDHHEKACGRDAMKMNLYPLAGLYLLNPAGIAALVIASREIFSLLMVVILIGFILLVGTIDWLFFRHMDKQAKHLDPSRLAVIGQ